MNTLEVLARMQQLAGFASLAEARAAMAATLNVLNEALLPDERTKLIRCLPRELALGLDQSARHCEIDLDAFHARVAQQENVPLGRATEHVQVACAALAETLPFETLTLLQRRLPALQTLFDKPETPQAPDEPERVAGAAPGEVRLRAAESTLARGRPGSAHPLSVARPVRAHSHSVLQSNEPHSDTKLSSSRGLTQEREHETLAEGKPSGRNSASTE